MKDHPIIFSAPMVQALLAGRKTMTRRLAWGKSLCVSNESCEPNGRHKHWRDDGDGFYTRPSPWQRVKPGARLWVRESFCKLDRAHVIGGAPFAYLADTTSDGDEIRKQYGYKWTPSIHMPRLASRLTLVVTATKIEPVRAISADDAWNEGVERRSKSVRQMWLFGANADEREAIYKRAAPWEFEELWKRLHGPESWDANPEVVALTFTVHKQNIDGLPKQEAA